MKLDCVITATDNNPLYLDFVPLFIKSWLKLYPSIDVKIIIVNNEIPPILNSFKKHLILFKPLINIKTSFIAQYIRLLYPAILNYKNGVLITDMDMLPMNNSYYTDPIKDISNDKFIYYRGFAPSKYQYAMCYNIASSKTWSEIFGIKNIEELEMEVKNKYRNGKATWFEDQRSLYKYINNWKYKSDRFVNLNDTITKFNRLDRICLKFDNRTIRNIKNKIYSDYHC